MADDVGIFASELTPSGWFAPETSPSGWFHPDLQDAPAAGGVDGNASGVTLTVNASLIGGTVAGEASASGEVFLSSTSLRGLGRLEWGGDPLEWAGDPLAFGDAATGDANVAGVILAATVSLIAGSASGENNSVNVGGGGGRPFAGPITRFYVPPRRNGYAQGTVYVLRATFEPGTAEGGADALANGTEFNVGVSFNPGAASARIGVERFNAELIMLAA